jgi:hypothetical protein
MAIRPHLGRFFSPDDGPANTHLAVMTYSCWKRLGSDPKIVGKLLAGNTIIGVTPKDFTGSFYGLNGDLFVLLSQTDSPASFEQRGARRLFFIARLKPGVSRGQAQAEMLALSGQLAAAYPKDDKGRGGRRTRQPSAARRTRHGRLMSAILMSLVLNGALDRVRNVAESAALRHAVTQRQKPRSNWRLAPRAGSWFANR